MNFQIRHDGKTYNVRTEVGNGTARVIFEEVAPAAPAPAWVRRAHVRKGRRRARGARNV